MCTKQKFYFFKTVIMKKIITWSLIGCVLFTSGVFASEAQLIKTESAVFTGGGVAISEPTLYSTDQAIESPTNDLVKKYELIIRNNILESDYKYNGLNYYTSKVLSKDIVVPTEIKDEAKRIYFLVEEWVNMVFYAEDSMWKGGGWVEDVKTEYNYKIVDFTENQEEYIFNNEDLLKDFWKDEYRNVQITLMADFSDTQRIPLSNTAYISIGDKKSVLAQLKNEEDKDNIFYWYFNWDAVETYLKNLAAKMTRTNYKILLEKAESKVVSANKLNEDNMKIILNSIKQEKDLKNNVTKYGDYIENQNLFMIVWAAVKNQLQNIKAFDAIDSILK